MKPRFVCPRCKSTFLESSIRTVEGGMPACPVCGLQTFYNDDSPQGLALLASTIEYESQALEICNDIERCLKNLYWAHPSIGWDEALEYFSDCYEVDSDSSIKYRVGFNSVVSVRLVLKNGRWRAVLAVNSENRVYLHAIYRLDI